jgi:hypothetical protein
VVNRCDFGFLGKMARADHVARMREHRNADDLADPSDKSVKDIVAMSQFCAALKSAPPRRP